MLLDFACHAAADEGSGAFTINAPSEKLCLSSSLKMQGKRHFDK
jgi:hypothetical protein